MKVSLPAHLMRSRSRRGPTSFAAMRTSQPSRSLSASHVHRQGIKYCKEQAKMKMFKIFTLIISVAFWMPIVAPRAEAQVSVAIGPAPVCPYGYYDYPPYACAPYGYYGPEWFSGGVFIGAGPWFHGRHDFFGHVDNHFDPRHGYRGPAPNRGDRPDAGHRLDHMNSFHGNEMRDGRGHVR